MPIRYRALALWINLLLFASIPARALWEQPDSADRGLKCELASDSVQGGQPIRVQVHAIHGTSKIEFDVVSKSNTTELSGIISRSAAVAKAADTANLLIDSAGLRPGEYRITITTKVAGKRVSCQLAFSIFFPTAAIRPEGNYQRVKIFFATDRAPGELSGDIQNFTSERSTIDGALTFGTAEISIPRDHRLGELERPSILKLEFREDPDKHVVLLRASVLDRDGFLNQVRDRVSQDPEKKALIFVHGYDVDFDEAARRLGQITYDLGFAGAPILYSWPSKGALLRYSADEATIDWVTPHFENFLHLVAEQTGVTTMFVVAHSMGNRVISGALKAIADKGQTLKPTLKEIVMAAPDIDAGVFQQLAAAIQTTGGRFTIYESSKDLALVASHTLHDFPRVGDTSPTVHVFDGYDVIEATKVDTGFLGHSYVFESGSILADVFELFKGMNADKRLRLVPMIVEGKNYWSFQK
jgi:esterase/lipase superfamily enzyme